MHNEPWGEILVKDPLHNYNFVSDREDLILASLPKFRSHALECVKWRRSRVTSRFDLWRNGADSVQ
jgi:hypothetical protein